MCVSETKISEFKKMLEDTHNIFDLLVNAYKIVNSTKQNKIIREHLCMNQDIKDKMKNLQIIIDNFLNGLTLQGLIDHIIQNIDCNNYDMTKEGLFS